MTHPSLPTSDSADVYPRPFGKYLLVHPLGEGGMGAVFLAKMAGVAGIEKLCVVKTLRPALLADDDYAARFLDEARLVVQLAHRNVCPVFDVGHVDGRYFLAMEHVAGRDLRRILARCHELGRRLSLGAALHLMSEVVDALDYAHRLHDAQSDDPLHLVHRDVSPQNVMVNFEGEVKLIDFGLALSTIKGQKTEPQNVMGKIAYMAPEHARGDALDGRADQFSAAIVLYEAMTGARFYGDLTPHQIWGVSGTGDHRPALLDTFDDDLRELLVRALAPRPDDRFPSCGALREALEAAMLARGVKGGDARRELRDTMRALFEDERLAEKALLARLTTGDDGKHTPVTTSTAAWSQAPAERAASVDRAEDRSETTAPIERPKAEEPAARPTHVVDGDLSEGVMRAAGLSGGRPPLARVAGAAAIAVVLLVGVGLPLKYLVLDPSGADEDALPPPPPVVSVDERAPTEALAKAPAPPVEPAKALQPSADASKASATDAASEPEPPDAAPPLVTPPPSRTKADAPTTSRQSSSSARKAQRRPEPPTGYKGMLEYVKRWCAKERCTAEVLAHDEAMRAQGEPSTDDLLRAVKALRRCVERCAR